MPLAFLLLFGAALLVYMGLENKSLQGILNDSNSPISNPVSTGTANPSQAITGVANTVGDSIQLVGANASTRAKVAAMLTMAHTLNGKPYQWGGGHIGWAIQAGYDCSGFVSAILHSAGYLSSPQSTQTLPSQPGILNGPGKYVSIFDRTDGGSPGNDHVIMNIAGQWWESGGSGGGGVHQISQPSPSYLTSFNRILHPKGL
jgi:cell wall-associated NlpC family hydrolase